LTRTNCSFFDLFFSLKLLILHIIVVSENIENKLVLFKQLIPFSIILLSAILFPFSWLPLTSGLKYTLISGLAALYFLLKTYFSNFSEKNVNFSVQDAFWILFVIYTFCSIAWSVNSFYALYGAFQVLFTFLIFKIFSWIQWDDTNINRVQKTIFIVFLSAILAEFYSLQEFILPGKYKIDELSFRRIMVDYFKVNLNYTGSLIVISLSLLVFKKGRKLNFINLALMLGSLFLIILSDSAQASIVLIFLILIKLLFIFKKNATFKITLICVVAFTIIGISNTNKFGLEKLPVFHEFADENDRIQMWTNSIKLFSESPLLGNGVNNWQVEVWKYGYNDYHHSADQITLRRFTHAHNFFFQFITELGLIGLVLIFGFVIWPILKSTFYLKSLCTFEKSSLICLYLFFLLTMIYGIIYNNYNFFSGIIVIVALALSIVSKSSKRNLFVVKERYATGLFFILAISSVYFFYKTNESNYLNEEVKELIQLKKYDEAEALNQKATSFSPKNINYLNEFKIQKANRNHKPALEAIQKALLCDPYNITLILHEIKLLTRTNQLEQALERTLFAYELNLNLIPTAIQLAKIYKRMEKSQEFDLLYEKFNDLLDKVIRRKNKHLKLDRINMNTRAQIEKELEKLKSFKTQLNNLKSK